MMAAEKRDADAIAKIQKQIDAVEGLFSVLRSSPSILDCWEHRHFSREASTLYQACFGRRPPGSRRTARLRKKRLKAVPHIEHMRLILRDRGAA